MNKYTVVDSMKNQYISKYQIEGYTHDIENAVIFDSYNDAKRSLQAHEYVYQIDDDIQFGDE